MNVKHLQHTHSFHSLNLSCIPAFLYSFLPSFIHSFLHIIHSFISFHFISFHFIHSAEQSGVRNRGSACTTEKFKARAQASKFRVHSQGCSNEVKICDPQRPVKPFVSYRQTLSARTASCSFIDRPAKHDSTEKDSPSRRATLHVKAANAH